MEFILFHFNWLDTVLLKLCESICLRIDSVFFSRFQLVCVEKNLPQIPSESPSPYPKTMPFCSGHLCYKKCSY